MPFAAREFAGSLQFNTPYYPLLSNVAGDTQSPDDAASPDAENGELVESLRGLTLAQFELQAGTDTLLAFLPDIPLSIEISPGYVVSEVPEPASFAMFGMGLLGLRLGRGRRKPHHQDRPQLLPADENFALGVISSLDGGSIAAS